MYQTCGQILGYLALVPFGYNVSIVCAISEILSGLSRIAGVERYNVSLQPRIFCQYCKWRLWCAQQYVEGDEMRDDSLDIFAGEI